MTKRIKITGYIDINDLEEEYVDLDDPSGLSPVGFDSILAGDDPRGVQWTVASLEENDAVLEDA